MDKRRFLDIAPLYYALAVKTALKKSEGKALTLQGVVDAYDRRDDDDPSELYNLLTHSTLLEVAMSWLREKGLVKFIDDDFGYPLLEDKVLWGPNQPAELEDQSLPFYKYAIATDGDAWLHSALTGVNRKYYELDVRPSDFGNPDLEWAPLPLERTDAALQTAIEKIDETLKQAREDNGYNATAHEERNYVVESLTAASRVLHTEASTSVPYVRKNVLEPLALLARRFANAALGMLSTAAKEAVIEYLKQHGINLLVDLSRHL